MNRQLGKRELAGKLPLELTEKLENMNSRLEVCHVLTEYLKCPVVMTDSSNKVLDKVIPKGKKRINITSVMGHLIQIVGNELVCDNLLEETGIQALYIPTNTPPYAIVVPLHIDGDFFGALWLINLKIEFKKDIADILEYAAAILIERVSNNQDLEVKRRQLRLEFLELLIESSQTASIILEEKIQGLGLEHLENWVAGLILPGENKLSYLQSIEIEAMCDECKKWIDETEGINGFCEIYKDQIVLLISSSLDIYQIKEEFNKLQKQLKNFQYPNYTSACIGGNKEKCVVF